jgi:hypothetical protein
LAGVVGACSVCRGFGLPTPGGLAFTPLSFST